MFSLFINLLICDTILTWNFSSCVRSQEVLKTAALLVDSLRADSLVPIIECLAERDGEKLDENRVDDCRWIKGQ